MTGFGDLKLKFPLILTISKIFTISVFMSNLNFMLSSFGHEKCCITSDPELCMHPPRLHVPVKILISCV